MIDREHNLQLCRQAELLKLSRSSIYHEAEPVPPGELAIMRQIDELHLNYPFAGSRMARATCCGLTVLRSAAKRWPP